MRPRGADNQHQPYEGHKQPARDCSAVLGVAMWYAILADDELRTQRSKGVHGSTRVLGSPSRRAEHRRYKGPVDGTAVLGTPTPAPPPPLSLLGRS